MVLPHVIQRMDVIRIEEINYISFEICIVSLDFCQSPPPTLDI